MSLQPYLQEAFLEASKTKLLSPKRALQQTEQYTYDNVCCGQQNSGMVYTHAFANVQSNTSLGAPVKGSHKCKSGPKSADLKKSNSHSGKLCGPLEGWGPDKERSR